MAEIRRDEEPKLSEFAFSDYDDFVARRRRVADCLGGQLIVKGEADKYLPRDKWQKEHTEDYAAYLNRALFFNYTRKALNRYVGMLDMGEPDIVFGSDKLEFMRDTATQFGDGLKALQRRVNSAQLSRGLICLLLESTGDNERPFVIQTYDANAFLRTDFVTVDGKSEIKFVLLDESGYDYNPTTKKDEYKYRMRVLGVDGRGYYYQAAISPEEWAKFNIDDPSGNVVYPDCFGKPLDRVPFTWCGASNLSGKDFQEPPILNVADAEISLYQLYADFRQVMFMTGQTPLVVTGLKGKVDEINKSLSSLKVGSGAVMGLPEGANAGYLEMAASSLQTISGEVETLKKLCTDDALSIGDARGNESGVALQLRVDSNTSPLQIINSTAGDAITDQLRYAARWLGLSDDEILETRYTPSKDFAEANLTVQELVAIESSESLTQEEKRKAWTDNGYGNPKITFDEFLDQKDADTERNMAGAMSQMMTGNTATGNPFATAGNGGNEQSKESVNNGNEKNA